MNSIYEYANNRSKTRKRNKTIRNCPSVKDIRNDIDYFMKIREISTIENIREHFKYDGVKSVIYNKFGFSFDHTKNRDIRRSARIFYTVRGKFYSYLTSVGSIRSKGGIYDNYTKYITR